MYILVIANNEMKQAYLIILGLFILFGCEQASEKESIINKIEVVSIDSLNETNKKATTENLESKIMKIDFDFLSDCDSLEMWQGGIQGIDISDSTGPYIMAQCFSNKHFDLIVYCDREIGLNEGANFKEKFIKKGITDAEYYAFEISKKVQEESENEFDTFDYIFPSEVKIYKLFDDGWYLIKKKNINSFEELGRLKLNSIYKKK
jgi:hypothetical protein